MKKVIGYIRVSTEYQNLKENSINNQIQSINKYCDNDDMCLIDIFEDNGVSGMNSDRSGLNQLFDKVKKDNIDIVIVYSLGRLGRKLKDVIGFVEMLDKPQWYLYDGAPRWDEAKKVSDEVMRKAFKSFSRKGIDMVWPRKDIYCFPYDPNYEKWHEEGF